LEERNNVTPARDKFIMQIVLVALIFYIYCQCFWLILIKALCSKGRTWVYDKVMYGAVSWVYKVSFVIWQFSNTRVRGYFCK